MKEEEPLTIRSLKASIWVLLITTTVLFRAGHGDWAKGFLVGALCSLFSIFSLMVIVPMLFRPGASPHVKGLLCMTLFMKLPLYALALYLVTSVSGFEPMGAGFGMALVPAVITLKTIGGRLTEGVRVRRLSARRVPAQHPAPTAQPIHAELVRERG
jgi:hypothetical protein